MTLTGPSVAFGTELRRRRLDAGLSLTALAKLVHYSKSHLSKVETGAKPATTDLARQCDASLASGGALARLVRATNVDNSAVRAGSGSGIGGPTDTPAAPLDRHHPVQAGEPTLASYRLIFDQMRRLGQWSSPELLVPQLAMQAQALGTLALRFSPVERDAALVLAARFAEYAGWLTQEAGDDVAAAAWTNRAVNLSARGGDPEMKAYALVRHGLIALYQDRAATCVDLARAAQASTTDPRIQGLAAQREAQGHALAGDYDMCMRAIDRAASRLSVAAADGAPVIGSSHVVDVVAIATGWCLVDLGRPVSAVQILTPEVDRIPPHALRARARFGARLALAYAAAGSPDAACAALEPVLDAVAQIESATIRTDLRDLSRVLNRSHANGAIRDTRLRLTDALNMSRTAS